MHQGVQSCLAQALSLQNPMSTELPTALPRSGPELESGISISCTCGVMDACHGNLAQLLRFRPSYKVASKQLVKLGRCLELIPLPCKAKTLICQEQSLLP